MKKLIYLADLDELFGFEGHPPYLEIDVDSHEPMSNMEDHFIKPHNHTGSAEEKRIKNISNFYNNLSPEGWEQLIDHRLTGSKQKIEIEFDGKKFISQNKCARYIMKTYGVSRNTAIRYLKEGRHPTQTKQSGRVYQGSYTASKYP